MASNPWVELPHFFLPSLFLSLDNATKTFKWLNVLIAFGPHGPCVAEGVWDCGTASFWSPQSCNGSVPGLTGGNMHSWWRGDHACPSPPWYPKSSCLRCASHPVNKSQLEGNRMTLSVLSAMDSTNALLSFSSTAHGCLQALINVHGVYAFPRMVTTV